MESLPTFYFNRLNKKNILFSLPLATRELCPPEGRGKEAEKKTNAIQSYT